MSKAKSITIQDVTPAKAATATQNQSSNWHTIAWFGMLLVVASIIFSSYIVFFGTHDLVSKALLVPQMLFATGVLIYKFVKK